MGFKFSVGMSLSLVVLIGCDEQSRPAPVASRSPAFAWSLGERPYQVLGVSSSNVPRLGDQARSAAAIYPDPQTRADVEEALQEIYGELKKDIEKVQRDGKYRRISIVIYDSEGDEKYDPDAFLCRLSLAPEPGVPLPERPDDAVIWQWRDPGARPDDRTRRIEWEYVETLEDINRSTLSPLMRSRAVPAAEFRATMEKTYEAESEELKRQIAEKYDLSVEELEELLDRVLKWKYEGASWTAD